MTRIVVFITVMILLFLCYGFGYLMGYSKAKKPKKKKRKSQYPRCDCQDVNQCSKWCHAKELFTQDSDNGLV